MTDNKSQATLLKQLNNAYIFWIHTTCFASHAAIRFTCMEVLITFCEVEAEKLELRHDPVGTCQDQAPYLLAATFIAGSSSTNAIGNDPLQLE